MLNLVLFGLFVAVVRAEVNFCDVHNLFTFTKQGPNPGIPNSTWSSLLCANEGPNCNGYNQEHLAPTDMRPDDIFTLDGDWMIKIDLQIPDQVVIFERTSNLEKMRAKALEMGYNEELRYKIGKSGEIITRFYKRIESQWATMTLAEQRCLNDGGRLPVFWNIKSVLELMRKLRVFFYLIQYQEFQ